MRNEPSLKELLTYRNKPFESKSWEVWQLEFKLPPSPKNLNQVINSNLESLGFDPDAKVNRAHLSTWNLWRTHAKVYDPKHLHTQAGIKSHFLQWVGHNRIPALLSFMEYWFLAEWLRAKGAKVDPIDPQSYEHPVPQGIYVKPKKSRLGKAYGTWLVYALADGCTSEQTYPLYYQVACKVCGHRHEKFNASRLSSHPCPACNPKPVKPKSLKLYGNKTLNPLTLWRVGHEWMWCEDMPKGANQGLVISEYGVLVEPINLTSDES